MTKHSNSRENQHVYLVSACLLLVLATLTFIALMQIWDSHDDKKFVEQYNYHVAMLGQENLQKDSKPDIRALAPGRYWAPEEWAWAWDFARRYDIEEIPGNDEITDQQMLQNLKDLDEYAKANAIPAKTVSDTLNSVTAAQQSDFIGLLPAMN